MKYLLGTSDRDRARTNTLIALMSEWYPHSDSGNWAPAKYGIQIEVSPIRHTRSTDQNSRYWVIVTALADHVGYTKAEMHEEVLSDMHGYELVEFRGSIKKKPKGRSHNLTTNDFSDLMAIAERWCAEMDVTWEEVA